MALCLVALLPGCLWVRPKAAPSFLENGMYVDVTAGQTDWRQIYRLCIGFVNPRPIALVSTMSPDGKHNLAPFSFYNMISANPPVVVFGPSIRRDRSRKDTFLNIEATREFVIATVTADIAPRAVRCGADLPYGESEFEFSGLTPTPATKVKPPLVKEAKANIECTLRQIVTTGDQPGSGCITFGNIVAIHIDDQVLDERGLIDPHQFRTVGRLGGKWYCNVHDPYEMEIPSV
jgi:flavin reductase (DIM6/NTAB) family NADH-FMN oxidoreductase RutF